jgi:hypothetical protein
MNKGERDAYVLNVIMLATVVGQRAAARQTGHPEATVQTWCNRYQKIHGPIKWPLAGKPLYAGTGQDPITALNDEIKRRGDATRLQLAIAADNASSRFAEMPPAALCDRDTAQALESTSRTGDRTHGWSAERAKAPVVQIANITVPTADDMQRDKDTDAKLDRITALLASGTLPSLKEGT